MPVFRTIVLAAALSGLLASLVVTAAQRFGTDPLIRQAEVHERAGEAPAAAAAAAEGWTPRDGLERAFYTAAANAVTGIGFALLLVAGLALRGGPAGWRDGLLWGLGGFAVFTLAPSLGLPPEPPGMPAAALGARQAWWLATVVATAAGLALLAWRRRSPASVALAVLFLVAPHLVGAPSPPPDLRPLVPEQLARSFLVAATVTGFLFWTLLGVLGAVLFDRFARAAAPAPAPAA